MSTLFVVMPAYNEEDNIEEVIKNYNGKKDNEYCYNGKLSKWASNTLTRV